MSDAGENSSQLLRSSQSSEQDVMRTLNSTGNDRRMQISVIEPLLCTNNYCVHSGNKMNLIHPDCSESSQSRREDVGGAQVLATGKSAEAETDIKYAIIGTALGVAILAGFLALKICMIKKHLFDIDSSDLRFNAKQTVTLN